MVLINYRTLTIEELEEYAEFVDWSMVPCSLLTNEVKTKFKSIPQLNARLWFEDLVSKMTIKEDQRKYPYRFFFFIDYNYFMDLNLRNGELWCSNQNIWILFLKNKIKDKTFSEIKLFIKNIMEQHYDITITSWSIDYSTRDSVEVHFKNVEAISPERIFLKKKVNWDKVERI